ncbi:MAG: RNA-guided endonuclease TnpB family protein [Candidatus Thermoplasmatota archaeon]|nr:RNA-guided endonuclease TnpB family protein [Candidatus Thermoplasmatota archaeon]
MEEKALKKAYKFRLYPNKKQKELLEQTLETCRILYNNALAERKERYEKEKKGTKYLEQANQLPIKKLTNPYLQQVHSQVLQDVLRRLDKAFQNFFRRVKSSENPGYPRFKAKNRFKSFTYPQSGFELKDGKLHLSKIGKTRIFQHRETEGRIRTLTIKRDCAGGWYAIFVTERKIPVIEIEPKTAVGVDVGLEKLAALSNGGVIEHPEFLRKSERRLKNLQRRLSRKKKRSKNREKARIKLSKLYRKIQRQREDFLHKEARKLVNQTDLIVFENLNINGMLKNHYLAKSIADSAWSKLIQFCAYKAEEAGKHIVLVSPNGTSQICSRCGAVVEKSLAVRIHKCPNCGLKIDRDLNASLNLLKKVGWGTAEFTPAEIGVHISYRR